MERCLMAKNIDVIQDFINGDNKPKTKNLRIEDSRLINYNTVIAERSKYGNAFVVNITKYSTSTSTIQNKLMSELNRRYLEPYIVTVNDIKAGEYNLKKYI